MVTNFDGWPFLLLAAALYSAVLLPAIWRKLLPSRNLWWFIVGCILMYLVYISRFSIGAFLLPSSGLILLGSVISILQDFRAKPFIDNKNDQLNKAAGLSLEDFHERMFSLTTREAEILDLIASGKTNKEIAHDLVISVNTVRHHVHQILKKLGCSSRAEAAFLAKSIDMHLEARPSKNNSAEKFED